MDKNEIRKLFRILSKKGVVDTLLFIDAKGSASYSDVLNFCIKEKIVDSRSTVTVIVNELTDYKLLERKVMQTRPVRTTYELSEKGKRILQYFKEIEHA